MRVVVLGAGLVGGRLLTRLVAAGHDARAFTRASGVDTSTGAGVAEAVAGADVVVDVTNSRAGSDDEVLDYFRNSTTHQLAAEVVAGVGHHVVLSVVGCDRVTGSGYLRAKAVQEQLVAAGAVPWSIVRSTQFFEFIGTIADTSTSYGTVRVPPATLQPIAAGDVAARLADVVGGAPSGVVEIAGPQRLTLDAAVRRLLAALHDPRHVVADPEAGYFGARVSDDVLTPGAGAWLGPTTFEDWLVELP